MPDIMGYDAEYGLQWLDDAKQNAKWYTALVRLDYHGDKKPLVKLLKSGEPVPPSIAFYLGDMVDRYELKNKRGPPRKPAYDRTREQIRLAAGVIYVQMKVKRGVAHAKALAETAAELGLPEGVLWQACEGKHGGLRRARKYWRKPAH